MRLATIAAFIVLGTLCHADAPPEKQERVRATPEARDRAIRAGLAYLDDRLFDLPKVEGTPREPFTWGVAGLAWLLAGDGTRATGGEHGADPVRRAQRRLEEYLADVEHRLKDPDNLPSMRGMADSTKLNQYTWPLGMAGLFFAEMRLCGVRADEATRDLRRIEAVLADAQEPNGGWGHGRVSGKEDKRAEAMIPEELRRLMKGGGGYPSTLLSSTNVVAPAMGVMSLRCGVPTRTLDKARAYYRAAILKNGNMPYDPSQRSAEADTTGAPRAAGAVFAFLSMGASADDPTVEEARNYVAKHREYLSEGHGSATYGLLMGALASRALGERDWREFWSLFAPRILGAQDKDGAIGCVCEGKSFGTSCDEGMLSGISVFEDGQKAYLTAIETLILLLDRAPARIVPTPARSVHTK